MTKPIEETWRVGNRVPRHIYRGDGPGDVVGMLDREEGARLAACAPEALRLLLAREWGRHNQCFECGGVSFVPAERSLYQGHKSSCAWVGLMRKAGVR